MKKPLIIGTLIVLSLLLLVGVGWLGSSFVNRKNGELQGQTQAPSPTPQLLQDNQSVIKTQEIQYDQMNNQTDAAANNTIDLNYVYLQKGSQPQTIYIGGTLTDIPTQDFASIDGITADMKYKYTAVCKINPDTQYNLITLKPDPQNPLSGNRIKTTTPNTEKALDKNKVTFLELKYSDELKYDSKDNLCLTVEQLND